MICVLDICKSLRAPASRVFLIKRPLMAMASKYQSIMKIMSGNDDDEDYRPNYSILKFGLSVDFEVFGRVQGVFFRRYMQEKAKELGVTGWCMNTHEDKGTVIGTIQGRDENVEEMKDWLRHTGSPKSKIEKCVFANERCIDKEEFDKFYIKE